MIDGRDYSGAWYSAGNRIVLNTLLNLGFGLIVNDDLESAADRLVALMEIT